MPFIFTCKDCKKQYCSYELFKNHLFQCNPDNAPKRLEKLNWILNTFESTLNPQKNKEIIETIEKGSNEQLNETEIKNKIIEENEQDLDPEENFCDICKKPFKNWKGIIIHKRRIHGIFGDYPEDKSEEEKFAKRKQKELESGNTKKQKQELCFRYQNGKLQLKKVIKDQELSTDPIEVWIDFEKSNGSYQNLTFCTSENVLEFSIRV